MNGSFAERYLQLLTSCAFLPSCVTLPPSTPMNCVQEVNSVALQMVMYTCTNQYIHVHCYIYIRMVMYTCMNQYIYVYFYVRMSIYTRIDAYEYVYIYAYIYINIFI